jgi:hypothetical protein
LVYLGPQCRQSYRTKRSTCLHVPYALISQFKTALFANLCGSQRTQKIPAELAEELLSVAMSTAFLVRRKWKGVHGTGYHVCGMDQQSRCSYFAWADQLESAGHEHCTPNCSLTTLSEQVWTLLGTSPSEGTSPLHVQLCEFLSRSWKGESPVQGPSVKGEQLVALKRYDGFSPGRLSRRRFFCSRERLGNTVTTRLFEEISGHSWKWYWGDKSANKDRLVFESLELLALVARPAADISSWYSLLCVIFILATNRMVCDRFKKALMQLCGRQRDLYAVRHHVFGFQFEKLIRSVIGV